jgi:hypothetical protein
MTRLSGDCMTGGQKLVKLVYFLLPMPMSAPAQGTAASLVQTAINQRLSKTKQSRRPLSVEGNQKLVQRGYEHGHARIMGSTGGSLQRPTV